MSTTIPHSIAPLGHVHPVVNWVFDTFDNMTAYTGIVALDLHKFAYVKETAFAGYYAPTAIDVGTGAVTWTAVGSSGGVTPTAFTALTDTPSSYTGAANYKVVVNAGATGLVFVPDSGGGGSGSTNLSYTASATQGVVNSDTGADAILPLSTGVNAGLMAPAQHTKLEGINLSIYALLASPTFTGTVVLPSTTSIGSVSATELGYLDGVTSAIQTQFTGKQDTLISATNIKTINGNSLLGSGDLIVGGGGGSTNLAYTASPTNGIVTSDTGSDATLPLADGTNAGLQSPSQYTKVNGLPADLAEYVRDTVAAFLVNGTNITITHNDGADTLTISRTGAQDVSTISNFEEAVQDIVGFGGISAGDNISLSYNDAGNTLVITGVLTPDLAAIEALTGTSGLLRKTAANTWTLDTSTYLTANQTITITGDVAGSGTTAITATIANDAVTFAKMQNIATAKLLGRSTSGAGDVEEITLGTNLSFTGTTLNATGGGSSAPVSARLRPIFQCDFLNSQGQLDWITFGSFTGGDSGFLPAGSEFASRHYGLVRFRCGTSANGGCRATTSTIAMTIQGGEVFDVVFKTPSSFLSTQILRFGFLNTTTGSTITDGAYFNVDGTGQVTCTNVNNSSATTSSVLDTLAAATWYNAKVTVASDASTITYDLYEDDGTLVLTHDITTNIPAATARVGVGIIGHSTGTTSADVCLLDYIGFSVPDIVRGATT